MWNNVVILHTKPLYIKIRKNTPSYLKCFVSSLHMIISTFVQIPELRNMGIMGSFLTDLSQERYNRTHGLFLRWGSITKLAELRGNKWKSPPLRTFTYLLTLCHWGMHNFCATPSPIQPPTYDLLPVVKVCSTDWLAYWCLLHSTGD